MQKLIMQRTRLRFARCANLHEKDITNNRKFWHTFKPFLTDKNKCRENIILVNNEKITSDAVELANALNNFFSNFIKNLKISEYYVEDKFPHSLLRHPTLNAIFKYKNHSNIRIIIISFLGVLQIFISHKWIKIPFLKKSENEI